MNNINKKIDGFLDPALIEKYLETNVDNSITNWNQLPHYSNFLGMDEAIELFTKVITSNKHIRFVHDSDVDGIGTYLITYGLLTFFNIENCSIIITNRKEGYGFIPKHLDGLNEGDLVITADNGITSHPACDLAKQMNVNVIITDHHQVDQHKGNPDAIIVDPHQANCPFPYKDINGTFVYWYFIKAIVEKFKIQINMIEYFLPELMLTTISDVMPLIHINRFVVKEGLKMIKTGIINKVWLQTYLSTVKGEITSEALAFGFIPSLNAPGRLTKAEDTAYFMVDQNPITSKQWFDYLQSINNDRKNKQFLLKKLIEEQYGSWLSQDFILVPGLESHTDFQKGILGPTAGNLAEHYKKPALVLREHTNDKGESFYSGSGRSVGDVNILGILKDSPHIVQDKTGGHKAACGVCIPKENLNDFFLYLQKQTKLIPKELFKSDKHVLGRLHLADIDWELFETIKKFEPYGQGFKRPQFLVKGKVKNLTKTKDKKHMFFKLEDGLGTTIRCAWFNNTQEIKVGTEQTLCVTIQHDDFKTPEKKELMLFVRSLGDFTDWV